MINSIDKALKKVDRIVEMIENLIMSLGIFTVSWIVFFNVMYRFLLSKSFSWSEELSRYIIVWVTFFALGACAKNDEHVTVDLFPNMLHGKTRKIHDALISFFCGMICIYLAYISIGFTKTQYLGGNTSVSLPLPIWLIYFSTSAGFIFTSYTYLRKAMGVFVHEGGER